MSAAGAAAAAPTTTTVPPHHLMPGFWNSSYPENLELSLEQETVVF